MSNNKCNEYFSIAKNWADDLYTEAIVSRNRYRIAFYWLALLASLLTFSIIIMIPLYHVELIMVHHYDDGTVWVEKLKQKIIPSRSQTESEIVRYVVNRESYSAFSYDERFSLISLLSSSKVAREYNMEQDITNSASPIKRLGKSGLRKVNVDNVIFLDNGKLAKSTKKNSLLQNLAQVDFRVTEINKITGRKKTIFFVALISWEYRGTPKNPRDKWRNWDGFLVTNYEVEQRNV